MGLSEKLLITSIVLSSMMSCKPNEYLHKFVKNYDISSSTKPYSVVIGNFNDDSYFPDVLSSSPEGITLTYPRRKGKIKTKNVYDINYDINSESFIVANGSEHFNLKSRLGEENIIRENISKRDIVKKQVYGFLSKGYINDDGILDIVYSSNSEVSVFINDGHGNFKKQLLYNSNSKLDSNRVDQNNVLNTILEDASGLHVLVCTEDKLLKFKSNHEGAFDNEPKLIYSFSPGESKNFSNISTGYFTNSDKKDILVSSLDGLFMLNSTPDSLGGQFVRSKNLCTPKNDGITNKNFIYAISIDRYSESSGNDVRLDDILFVDNNSRTYFENNDKGKFRKGVVTKHDLDKDLSSNISISLDSRRTANNIIVYVATPIKIETIVFGPKEN